MSCGCQAWLFKQTFHIYIHYIYTLYIYIIYIHYIYIYIYIYIYMQSKFWSNFEFGGGMSYFQVEMLQLVSFTEYMRKYQCNRLHKWVHCQLWLNKSKSHNYFRIRKVKEISFKLLQEVLTHKNDWSEPLVGEWESCYQESDQNRCHPCKSYSEPHTSLQTNTLEYVSWRRLLGLLFRYFSLLSYCNSLKDC